MLGLPRSPVAVQGKLAKPTREAGEVFLLPTPGRLEPVPRPFQFPGSRPFIRESVDHPGDLVVDLSGLNSWHRFDLKQELTRSTSPLLTGFNPGGELLALDQVIP